MYVYIKDIKYEAEEYFFFVFLWIWVRSLKIGRLEKNGQTHNLMLYMFGRLD